MAFTFINPFFPMARRAVGCGACSSPFRAHRADGASGYAGSLLCAPGNSRPIVLCPGVRAMADGVHDCAGTPAGHCLWLHAVDSESRLGGCFAGCGHYCRLQRLSVARDLFLHMALPRADVRYALADGGLGVGRQVERKPEVAKGKAVGGRRGCACGAFSGAYRIFTRPRDRAR